MQTDSNDTGRIVGFRELSFASIEIVFKVLEEKEEDVARFAIAAALEQPSPCARPFKRR